MSLFDELEKDFGLDQGGEPSAPRPVSEGGELTGEVNQDRPTERVEAQPRTDDIWGSLEQELLPKEGPNETPIVDTTLLPVAEQGTFDQLEQEALADPMPEDVTEFSIANVRVNRLAAAVASSGLEGIYGVTEDFNRRADNLREDLFNGDLGDRARALVGYAANPAVGGMLFGEGLNNLREAEQMRDEEVARKRRQAADVSNFLLEDSQGLGETVGLVAAMSLGRTLPGIVVGRALPTSATAQAAAGTLPMVAMETSTSTLRGLDDGLSKTRAEIKGLLDGAIEGGGQFLSFKSLFKESDTFAKKIAEFLVVEETTEMGVTALQKMVEWGVERPEEDARTILLEELPYEMMLTALSVPVSGGVQSGIVHGSQRASEALEPKLQRLEEIGKDLRERFGVQDAPATQFTERVIEAQEGVLAAKEERSRLEAEDMEIFLGKIGEEMRALVEGAPDRNFDIAGIFEPVQGVTQEELEMQATGMLKSTFSRNSEGTFNPVDGRGPSLVVDKTGRPGEAFRDAEPGRVYMNQDPKKHIPGPLGDRFAKFVQDFWSVMNPDAPLFLTFGDATLAGHAPGSVNGFQGYVDLGRPEAPGVEVVVDPATVPRWSDLANEGVIRTEDQQAAALRFFSTLTHELGHAVVAQQFLKAPQPVREAVYQEWRKTIGPDSPGDQTVAELGANYITSANDIYDRFITMGRTPQQYQDRYTMTSKHAEYLTSFLEWFAQRMDRESMIEGPVNDLAMEHFSELRERIEEMHQMSADSINKWSEQGVDTRHSTPSYRAYVERIFRLPQLRIARDNEAAAVAEYQASMEEMAAIAPDMMVEYRYGGWINRLAEGFGTALKAGKGAVPPDIIARFTERGPQIKKMVDTYNWRLRMFGGLLHLQAKNPHIQSLTDYVNVVRDAWATKMQWTTDSNETIRDYIKLSRNQQIAVGQVAIATDLESTNKKRKLTKEEVLELVEKEGIDITDKGLAILQQMWDMYDAASLEMQRRAIDKINKTEFDPDPDINAVRRAKEVLRVERDFSQMRNRNYLPHTRFGEYTLELFVADDAKPMEIDGKTWYPGDRVTFETYETERQRDRAVKDYNRMLPPGVRFEASKLNEQDTGIVQGLPVYLQQMINKNIQLTEDQQRQLDMLALDLSPSQSFRKRLMKRKNIQGYSDDVGRIFAEYFTRYSNFLMSMELSDRGELAIQQTERESRSAREGTVGLVNRTKRAEVANHMRRHLDYMLNPGNEWASLRATGFLFYLGYSPKAALVNLSQVPLVTWPALTARFGTLKGTKVMSEVMRDMGGFWQNPSKRFTEGEEEMVDILRHRGILEQSSAMELAAAKEGPYLSQWRNQGKAFGQADYMLRQAAHYGAWMFQQAETFNRQVTARAAYRLARDRGDTWEDAVDFAHHVTDVTQFEYSRWNRPEMFRGKVGSNVFLFYQYVTNMLHFMGNEPGRARYLLALLGMAGIQGLPFAENIMDIFDYLFTKMKSKLGLQDPKVSSRVWLYEQVDEMLEGVVDLGVPEMFVPSTKTVMYGAARMTPVDLHGSLSMGNIIPGTGALATGGGLDRAGVGRAAEDAGGAVINMPLQLIYALGSDEPDSFRKFEAAMPTMMRGLSAAYRYTRDGAEKTRGGQHVADFDLNDPSHRFQIALRALGFPLTRVSEERTARFRSADIVRYYETQRRLRLADIAYAYDQEDQKLIEESWEKIDQFNRQLPTNAKLFSISRDTVNTSVLNRRKAYELSRENTYRTFAGRELYEEVYRKLTPDNEDRRNENRSSNSTPFGVGRSTGEQGSQGTQ